MKRLILVLCALALATTPVFGGAIFLTGHDPDFHASLGGNLVGARAINVAAINFITDSAFNPFNNGSRKLLFVESSIPVPGGHTDGENGLIASGYGAGTYERHDASTLATELGLLGTKYDGIVVASDFGGILTQAELNVLNANSAAIISFLNAGGGLYAMAEGNSGAHLTPGGGWFGYLPFVTTSTAFNQTEVGIGLTAFGASLGLNVSDVNGNASHNIFTGTFGLNIVDYDQFGHTLSLAGRGQTTTGGVDPVPEPGTMLLLGSGLCALARWRRRIVS